jgi:phage gp29-like protein
MGEGLAGLERWAQGILDAEIGDVRLGDTSTSNQAVVSAVISTLEKMRSRFVYAHGPDVKLNIHETSGSGHEMVISILGMLSTSIRTLILGANLPTSATSGGSYALAEVQENSTETLVNYDRLIMANAITRDVIGLWWRMNTAQLRAEGLADAEPPSFRIVSRISRDGNAASQISTLLNAGVRNLREDEVFEACGFTPAGPFDKALELATPAGAGVAEAPKAASASEPSRTTGEGD